jgi:hypothetical protein
MPHTFLVAFRNEHLVCLNVGSKYQMCRPAVANMRTGIVNTCNSGGMTVTDIPHWFVGRGYSTWFESISLTACSLQGIRQSKSEQIFQKCRSYPKIMGARRVTLWTVLSSGVPRNFFSRLVYAINFFWGRVQQIQLGTEGRENGDMGGGSPLVRGSTQFGNEWNPYSD